MMEAFRGEDRSGTSASIAGPDGFQCRIDSISDADLAIMVAKLNHLWSFVGLTGEAYRIADDAVRGRDRHSRLLRLVGGDGDVDDLNWLRSVADDAAQSIIKLGIVDQVVDQVSNHLLGWPSEPDDGQGQPDIVLRNRLHNIIDGKATLSEVKWLMRMCGSSKHPLLELLWRCCPIGRYDEHGPVPGESGHA